MALDTKLKEKRDCKRGNPLLSLQDSFYMNHPTHRVAHNHGLCYKVGCTVWTPHIEIVQKYSTQISTDTKHMQQTAKGYKVCEGIITLISYCNILMYTNTFVVYK